MNITNFNQRNIKSLPFPKFLTSVHPPTRLCPLIFQLKIRKLLVQESKSNLISSRNDQFGIARWNRDNFSREFITRENFGHRPVAAEGKAKLGNCPIGRDIVHVHLVTESVTVNDRCASSRLHGNWTVITVFSEFPRAACFPNTAVIVSTAHI